MVSCYNSSQLASHFIGHFSDHLVLAIGKGGKATLGICGLTVAPVFLPFSITSVIQAQF